MIDLVTGSAQATEEFGQALCRVLKSRDIVLLVGDLGAGKTTLTKGLGRGLGIDEPITSPTFVLLRSYQGRMKLHHADVYRLEHLHEVVDLGLLELLDDGGVALIEWGDMAEPALPRDYLSVRLSIDPESDERRRLQLTCVGESWSGRHAALIEATAPWQVPSPGGDQ